MADQTATNTSTSTATQTTVNNQSPALFDYFKNLYADTLQKYSSAGWEGVQSIFNSIINAQTIANSIPVQSTSVSSSGSGSGTGPATTDIQSAIDDLSKKVYGIVSSSQPTSTTPAAPSSINPWLIFVGVFILLWVSTIFKRK